MKQNATLALVGAIWLAIVLGCSLSKENSNAPSSPTQNNNVSSTQNANTTSNPTTSPLASPSAPGITMANYKRLNLGMTYAQVVEILGEEGTELSSNDLGGYKITIYRWGEAFGTSINMTFQNDKLMSKSQSDLK